MQSYQKVTIPNSLSPPNTYFLFHFACYSSEVCTHTFISYPYLLFLVRKIPDEKTVTIKIARITNSPPEEGEIIVALSLLFLLLHFPVRDDLWIFLCHLEENELQFCKHLLQISIQMISVTILKKLISQWDWVWAGTITNQLP